MADYIGAIMTTELYQARDTERAGQVIQDLVQAGISGCPVINAAGSLVGVVSWRDLVRCDGETPVRERMTSPSIVTSPDTSLADAARLMTDGRVHRLIVAENNRVVGIVSAADIVRAVSARPRLSLVQAASIG